jgi:hypothetical protein
MTDYHPTGRTKEKGPEFYCPACEQWYEPAYPTKNKAQASDHSSL